MRISLIFVGYSKKNTEKRPLLFVKGGKNMTSTQRIKNLSVPTFKVDVVLDTDAFNEIDDQYAISYLLRNKQKLNTVALYAAPFHNALSKNAGDGMEKSYEEIQRLLGLLREEIPVYRGSLAYLPDEKTPVDSPAARDLAARAEQYSPENPLYVVAIGAITNVASAVLLNPKVAENTVIVWLGGHAHHYANTKEFNMMQDYAAARVVMGSGVPFVQLPCEGVVSEFRISKPELLFWLKDKNPIANYLAENTIKAADSYAMGRPWTRVIWDVTAVAWLLNDGNRFMASRQIQTRLPSYGGMYEEKTIAYPMEYVFYVRRDALMQDLIEKLSEG